MNIFVLNQDPYQAAKDHCDKHAVKMILEYGQMLSTAHRLCDGKLLTWKIDPSTNNGANKVLKHYLLVGESAQPAKQNRGSGRPWRWEVAVENAQCHKAAHVNHPCSVWTRETDCNYHWLFMLFDGCLREYTTRYGKVHSSDRLREFLRRAPMQIPRGLQTPFAQAMPEEYKHEDPVEAYHRFYIGAKARFAKWTNTPVPKWFIDHMEGQDVTSFSRTR